MSISGSVKAPDSGMFYLLSTVAIAFILPNTLIFSTDDLFIYVRAGSSKTFFMNQSGEGRYSFSAICWILNHLQISIGSYILISVTSLGMALSFLFSEFANRLKIESRRAVIIGFLAFLFFGLNLDLFQFTFAQLSYAIGFACLAAVLRVAGRGESSSTVRLLTCIVLATIAIGSYQLYIIYALVAVMSISFVHILRAGVGGIDRRLILFVTISDLAGSIIYLVINGALRAIRFSEFTSYPQREQGIRFIAGNVGRYLETLKDLIWIDEGNAYSALIPMAVKALFVLLICSLMWRSRSLGAVAVGVLASVLAGIVVLWANPVNMLLSAYWPSARSLSTFGIFVGAIVASHSEIIARSEERGHRSRLEEALIALLIAFEFTNAVVRFKDRSIRQVEDIALAQSIVSTISDHRSTTGDKALIVGTTRAPENAHFEVAYDYGISMFQTPWSISALLQYVSHDRLNIKIDHDNRCQNDIKGPYSIRYNEEDTLVCVRF